MSAEWLTVCVTVLLLTPGIQPQQNGNGCSDDCAACPCATVLLKNTSHSCSMIKCNFYENVTLSVYCDCSENVTTCSKCSGHTTNEIPPALQMCQSVSSNCTVTMSDLLSSVGNCTALFCEENSTVASNTCTVDSPVRTTTAYSSVETTPPALLTTTTYSSTTTQLLQGSMYTTSRVASSDTAEPTATTLSTSHSPEQTVKLNVLPTPTVHIQPPSTEVPTGDPTDSETSTDFPTFSQTPNDPFKEPLTILFIAVLFIIITAIVVMVVLVVAVCRRRVKRKAENRETQFQNPMYNMEGNFRPLNPTNITTLEINNNGTEDRERANTVDDVYSNHEHEYDVIHAYESLENYQTQLADQAQTHTASEREDSIQPHVYAILEAPNEHQTQEIQTSVETSQANNAQDIGTGAVHYSGVKKQSSTTPKQITSTPSEMGTETPRYATLDHTKQDRPYPQHTLERGESKSTSRSNVSSHVYATLEPGGLVQETAAEEGLPYTRHTSDSEASGDKTDDTVSTVDQQAGECRLGGDLHSTQPHPYEEVVWSKTDRV